MGYMGLGMKKFIRKLQPKKMYERRQREGYDLITENDRRKKFKLQASQGPKMIGMISQLVVFLLCLFIGGWLVNKYQSYGAEHLHQMELNNVDDKNFNYLISAGDAKMERSAYEEAIYDYQLALDIYPDDSNAQIKMKRAKDGLETEVIK